MPLVPQEEEEDKNLEELPYWTNIWGIFLLFLLYMCIGLFTGYFVASVLLIVTDKPESTYSDLGTINWIFLPFSFKPLVAPFVDAFYIKHIGKRKSWICLVTFSMGALMIYYSFKIQEYIDDLNIF